MINGTPAPTTIGIVEGFFSRPLAPWTLQERLDTLRFCREFAPYINAYFYCPKQDRFVTENWEELYPSHELAALVSVIEFCKQHGIQFTYGLNPALDQRRLSSPTEVAKWRDLVRRKLKQVRAIGCDSIALLFDDVPLAYDVVDSMLSEADESAALMVNLVNEIYAEFSSELKSFYFCSPDYCLREETVVTRAQLKLDPGIRYVWTGNAIFAPTVNEADTLRAAKIRGIDSGLAWWVNYPVNDCEHNCGIFNLGGFIAPGAGAAAHLEAIFVNPMRECAANFPFYMTLSDYARDPESYVREKSWTNALEVLFEGNFAACAMILEEFSAPNCADRYYRYGYSKIYGRSNEAIDRFFEEIRTGLWQAEKLRSAEKMVGRFMSAVELVCVTAQWWHDVGRKVLGGIPLSIEDVSDRDLFPTSPREARYCSEILRIVQARLKIIDGEATLPRDLLDAVQDFEARYQGRAKLVIAPADALHYEQTSQAAIRFEQERLVRMLNDGRLTVMERLSLLSRRLSVNRFTLP